MSEGVSKLDGKSWLAEWMDAEGVSNLRKAEKAVKDPRALRRLRDSVDPNVRVPAVPDLSARAMIAAGAGLDLSGAHDCWHWECLNKKVDSLYQRVWHYFDKIAVEGPPRSMLRNLDGGELSEELLHRIRNHLYVRSSGLEGALYFQDKPPRCTVHLEEHAEEAGLMQLVANEAHWTARLSDEMVADFETGDGNHVHYAANHPLLEHTQWGCLGDLPPEATDDDMRQAALSDVFRRFAGSLISDVQFAQLVDSPLAANAPLHAQFLNDGESAAVRPSAADVAYEIRLPFLEGVPAAEIRKMVADNWDSYDVFHNSLRLAIQERLRSDDALPSAATLAVEIGRDVIEPALAKIHRDVLENERTLRKTTALSVAVGAVGTVVGLLTAAPVFIGLGGALVPLVDLRGHIGRDRDVKTADMYFLWKLRQQHEASGSH